MYPFFVTLHVLLCTFLIFIIMLQPGKGGDVSAAFGGGSSSALFGPRGPTGLLQRATTVVAVLFMGTTITLALYSNRGVRANANVEDELQRLQQLESQKVGADAASVDGADAPAPGGEAAAPEAAPLVAPISPAAPAPATP